jgi:hypothetical protein
MPFASLGVQRIVDGDRAEAVTIALQRLSDLARRAHAGMALKATPKISAAS